MIFLLFFLYYSCSPKRGSNRGMKKLYYVEIESLYSSPNIVRLIKQKIPATHTAETRKPYKTLVAKVKERDYLKYLGTEERIILNKL
jgi:hypothetical protein